jgi:hypothetical protein
MKAIRPLLSLVIAMSLAPIAVAQAPATDAPVLTREFPDDSLRVPLSEAFPGLSLSNDLDILTKDGESYATRFETLHKTIEPLCHVATLPTSHAIVERCSKNPAEQVTVWRRFIASLLQGNPSNTKPSNRPDAASGIYLIDESGKTLTPVTRESLPKALLKDKSSAPPLSVSFDPPCKFPATPTGAKVAKLCTKSLPIPPVSASIEGDTLVLKRLQNEAAEAFISFGQEPAAPRVLINLWAAGTNFCIAGGKRYKDTSSLNTLFRSPEVPFGSQCERVTLTCKARNWLDGEVVVDVNQFPRSCKVQKPQSCTLEGRTVAERRTIAHGATLPLFRASEAPVGERCQRLVRKCENGVMTGDEAFRFSSCSDTQACTFDKKTIKDKGTIDAYKLNVVDSSTGRKCSEPTNMMRLTCTNGQLSAPKDWTSFPFSTCTARPMPGCNVNDKTQPLGYRTIPHGDTREVFTSATAPSGSSCASVKKTAQCLNARMWVDGVATALFTQFFSECKDRAPGGPGGIAPGYDGHCETEELPDVEGQDPVYIPKCTDPDCSGKGPCPPDPGTNGSAEDCTDGIDNEGDGLTDCADPDCAYAIECNEDPEPDCYCENLDRELSQSETLLDLDGYMLRAAEMAARFYRRRSETSPNAETQSQYSLAQARADRIRRSLLKERRRMDLLAQEIERCREVSSPAKRECFEQCDQACAGLGSTRYYFLRVIYHEEARLWDAKLQIEEISARPMTLSSRDSLDSLNRGVLEISANITALKKKLEETIDQYFECRATLPPGCRDTNWISRDDETIPDPPL